MEETTRAIEKVDDQVNDVVNKLLEESDVDKAKEILKLFNMNIAKKNAVRVVKLNGLLDRINEQAIARLESHPDEVSNKDLLGYMSAVQNQLEKSSFNANSLTDLQAIQFNQQNNITINAGESGVQALSKESRDRVLAAVNEVLALAQKEADHNDIIDVEVKGDSNGGN